MVKLPDERDKKFPIALGLHSTVFFDLQSLGKRLQVGFGGIPKDENPMVFVGDKPVGKGLKRKPVIAFDLDGFIVPITTNQVVNRSVTVRQGIKPVIRGVDAFPVLHEPKIILFRAVEGANVNFDPSCRIGVDRRVEFHFVPFC